MWLAHVTRFAPCKSLSIPCFRPVPAVTRPVDRRGYPFVRAARRLSRSRKFAAKFATVYPSYKVYAMATAATNSRKQAHELIDRMAPSQVLAVVGLLRTMLDPVSRAIASAPIDDEPETEEERKAVAASKAWMAEHPGQGIKHEEILAEFGLSAQDLR